MSSPTKELPNWVKEAFEYPWHKRLLTNDNQVWQEGDVVEDFTFCGAVTLPPNESEPERWLFVFSREDHFWGVLSGQSPPIMCFGGPHNERSFCPLALQIFGHIGEVLV